MNAIFIAVFSLSTLAIMIVSPENFLPAISSAAQKSGALSLTLLSSYCVWCGLMQVMDDCSISKKIAKVFHKPVKGLFKTENTDAVNAVSMNISANILGLGSAATPYGIRGAELLSNGKSPKYSHAMLLVFNCASIQLLPTTAISVLTSYGARSAYSIILPTLLSGLFSLFLGIILVKIFVR